MANIGKRRQMNVAYFILFLKIIIFIYLFFTTTTHTFTHPQANECRFESNSAYFIRLVHVRKDVGIVAIERNPYRKK